jgi:NAD(P)-dependent dehydrogenase (short-subunit alcohol dehydrogenase family)
MSETWLVTGANRGIGLEHVRQALAAGTKVIATARHPDKAVALQGLAEAYPGQLRIEPLDTGDGASIAALAANLAATPVDVLINNAGLYGGSWDSDAGRQSLEGMDYLLWEEIMRVNVLGPFRLTVALLPQIRLGTRRLVAMMSSDLGSISNNTMGQSHAYRSSKAALNMLTKGLSIDLADENVAVVSLAPGWTRTELGGSNAPWSVEDSVLHQREVIAKLNIADSGKFINLLGEQVAW